MKRDSLCYDMLRPRLQELLGNTFSDQAHSTLYGAFLIGTLEQIGARAENSTI